jgi:putative PEP-CTERM system TPR-repeat lipoprotein
MTLDVQPRATDSQRRQVDGPAVWGGDRGLERREMTRWTTRGSLVLLALCVALSGCRKDPEIAKQGYFESGNRYFEQGQYAEAIVEYRNAVKVDPMFGEAHLQLAEAYARTENPRAAVGEYVRAADLLPENREAQLKAGAVLLLAGQFEEARARADRLMASDPTDARAQVLRANAMAGLKDVDGAIREIEEAIQLDPLQSGVYQNLGVLQMAKGETADAESAFRKAVELDPKSVAAHLGLANFFWQSGRRAEAEGAFLEARALDATNEQVNRALASFYIAVGEPARAEDYLRALVASARNAAPALLMADYYLAMRRPADALPLLEQAVAQDAFFVPAKARIATIQYAEGNREQAHATIDETLARAPNDVTALLVKARLLVSEGRFPEAMVRAQAAVRADQRSALANYLVGSIAASTGDLDAAVASFNEVLALNPRAVSAQLALARIELRRGRADSSVQLAQEALSNAPDSPGARLFLARGLLARGAVAQSETETRWLLERFPDAAPVHVQLGSIAMARRDLAGARRAFEKAQSLDDRSLEARAGLIAVDLAEKRTAEARTRADALLALPGGRSAAVLLAARTYAAVGDAARAERTLRAAVEADPSNYAAFELLGRLYIGQRRLDDALREFETITSRQPDSVSAHTLVAMIYQAQGRLKESKERYERVMQIDSKAAVAANNLAWLYAEEGENLDLALQLAQTARQQLPEQPEVSDTLGYIYLRKELPALAIPAFQESIDRDPNNATYHYRLGVALARIGDKAAARRALERALALKSDFAEASEARQLLASLS